VVVEAEVKKNKEVRSKVFDKAGIVRDARLMGHYLGALRGH
jgi:hypothetical protein